MVDCKHIYKSFQKYSLSYAFLFTDAPTSVINTLIWAFCTTEWMLYIGSAIAFLDSTSTTVFRSMITKIVKPDEIGKVFSVVAIFQAILPFIGAPLFGILYKNTVATQPNTFLFLIVALKVLVFLIVVSLYFKMRKAPSKITS